MTDMMLAGLLLTVVGVGLITLVTTVLAVAAVKAN